MNRYGLWLPVIVLAGFALRLAWLGEQSLWYDEGVTWMMSQMIYLSDLIHWTAADIQPPLYYLLIWHTYIGFGQSEWALRFPSVLFNTLTIPLIYALARRLFTPRSPVSLLAGLLFAVSPLLVYYSQEARMYTLLVFEAVLAGYLLLKITHPDHRGRGTTRFDWLPLLYALIATAALYTHYFAAFLLMAHAVYLLIILWQRGWPKTLLIRSLWMFGLSAVLFAPWLATLLSRLGDDPSYWSGALKLDEAARKVVISFIAGETVFEQTGLWLALGFLGLLLLMLAFLWVTRSNLEHSPRPTPPPDKPRVTLFLLLWLFLPPLLILVLSHQSPKFNPRYTLLAWPAFALVLAGLLARLLPIQQTSTDVSPARITPPIPAASARKSFLFPVSRFRPHLAYGLFSLIFVFSLATSAFSLFNWFVDPRFSKDDFKALAQFIDERSGPDETVLLSSGHFFPVWAYYFGWKNWTPLPDLQRLDVSQVTDLTIADRIAAAVEGKEGVWLVTWQDEVIDPNGVVPFWLDRIGDRPADAGDFWGVSLEHWRLNPRKIDRLYDNAIDQASSVNFANQIDLVGMTQLSDTELALFWRPRQALPDDLLLTLSLTDEQGLDWARQDVVGRPGAYLYPPSRWPVGKVVMTRHPLPWQIGTPPGRYIAAIGLGQAAQAASAAADFVGWDVLDEQGRPQRRTALLEFVNLSHLIEPDSGPLPPGPEPLVDFWPIVAVRRSILPQETVEPGDRILLALLWQAGEFHADDISVAFDLIDAENETFRVGSALTPSRRFNLPRWYPGAVVLGQYWLDIPPDTAPGPATLQLHLINQGAYTYDEVFPIDQLDIRPTERNFTPPASADVPLEADFSNRAVLIGVDCSIPSRSNCQVAAPGETVTLTLYWRAEAGMDKNYTVFTHLLSSDETVIVNADHAPPKPTQGWVPTEIIADTVALTLPADLPAGDYRLEVGLYDAADPAFARLPLTTGETRLILPQALSIEK
jgi:hypothetical protein